MIYLYGLMAPSAPPPATSVTALEGVTGPVFSKTLPTGHLIYGHHDGQQILARRRLMLAHTAILEAASTAGTVLPMRFGLLADSIDAVTALVARQEKEIASHFARLAGHVEYGVRISFPGPAALTQALSGNPALRTEKARLEGAADHFATAAFGRKLGEVLERRRTDAQHKLVSRLRGFVADLVLRAPETEFQVLNAHILLPASEEPSLPVRLSELAAGLDFAPTADPAITLVGPAPLFNFVRLTLSSSPAKAA